MERGLINFPAVDKYQRILHENRELFVTVIGPALRLLSNTVQVGKSLPLVRSIGFPDPDSTGPARSATSSLAPS